MNNATTFYIVRHGETHSNANNIRQGHADSPLSEKGIKQAHKRAKSLSHIKFDEAFSSDLYRAQNTAEIIAINHNLAVKTNQLLRERTFGRFDGTPRENFFTELKDLLAQKEKLADHQKETFKLGDDIETDNQIASRMLLFIRETAIAYPSKIILMVAHGGIMRQFLIKMGYATYSQFSYGGINNLGYFVLKTDGIEFELIKTEGVPNMGK